jgi:hypothetical protein
MKKLPLALSLAACVTSTFASEEEQSYREFDPNSVRYSVIAKTMCIKCERLVQDCRCGKLDMPDFVHKKFDLTPPSLMSLLELERERLPIIPRDAMRRLLANDVLRLDHRFANNMETDALTLRASILYQPVQFNFVRHYLQEVQLNLPQLELAHLPEEPTEHGPKTNNA